MKFFGFRRLKMLEGRVNRAHLRDSSICLQASLNPPSSLGILFVIASPSAASPASSKPASSDLFDQSTLSTLAQRLVEAAKRAGADAADAVAVRGVSQGVEVRDGRVEESERSEGDDVGLRVLVGQRQAVVSTNDVSGDGIAVKGVTRSGGASASSGIGGMVLVTSTGFHGSYLRSSQGISMTAISGEGTGMERDYDFTSAPHGSDLASPESVGRKAGERTVARSNPRKVETCKVPVVFDPRVAGSIVGHLVGAVNGASIARKTSFLKDRLGEQLFSKDIRIIDDPLRVRGLRSQTFDVEGVKVKKTAIIDEGVLTTWLLDSATARELGMVTTGHAHRGVSSAPSPGAYNLHLEPGSATPAELMSDIKQGFYITDLIGSGVNGVTGDYSRGASGFWIENGEITYAVSEVTIAGHLLQIFKSLVAANDLEFRYGVNAPTVRIEGLTVGGR